MKKMEDKAADDMWRLKQSNTGAKYSHKYLFLAVGIVRGKTVVRGSLKDVKC
jgi:hypothetical protein